MIPYRTLLASVVDPTPRLRLVLSIMLVCVLPLFFFLGTRPGAAAVIPPAPFDKLAHMAVFGGFAAIVWVIGAGRSRWLPLLFVLALGCMDEFLQARTPGRDADWHDLVADLTGALLAVAILEVIRRRHTLLSQVSSAVLGGATRPESPEAGH